MDMLANVVLLDNHAMAWTLYKTLSSCLDVATIVCIPDGIL